MKLTVLGCGASGGVPMISSGWGRCDPTNPRNRRRRPSVLIEIDGKTILVDTGPDMREQLLGVGVNHLSAVLFTHAHADHCHGIDDLREVNRAMRGPVDAYGSETTLNDIEARFDYIFEPVDPSATSIYKPWLIPHVVSGRFNIDGIAIEALDQDHGFSRTTGYRIGSLAYCTDVWEFPPESFERLYNLDYWIVGCLLNEPHPTHAHVEKIIAWAEILKPRHVILTHMCPRLDYATLRSTLPHNIEPAYDGMVLQIDR